MQALVSRGFIGHRKLGDSGAASLTSERKLSQKFCTQLLQDKSYAPKFQC